MKSTTDEGRFPMVIRSFGVSFSILGQFVATVVLLEAAPTAFQNIEYKFWIILICLTVLYAVWVHFFLPEVSCQSSIQRAIMTRIRPKV